MVRFAVPAPEDPPSSISMAAGSSATPTSTSTSATGDCLKCHKNQITYECDPCGCPSYCTDCARKLASGGKCKVCHEFFGGLRRLRGP